MLKTIANKINFVSNNMEGFWSTNKRLKLIKYFKDKIVCSDFLFLRETHSTVNDAIKGKDDFKGEGFYSSGTYNSCGILISFIGSKKLFIINKLLENDRCIIILITLYNNPNT